MTLIQLRTPDLGAEKPAVTHLLNLDYIKRVSARGKLDGTVVLEVEFDDGRRTEYIPVDTRGNEAPAVAEPDEALRDFLAWITIHR